MKKIISLVLCFVIIFGTFNLSGCVTMPKVKANKKPGSGDGWLFLLIGLPLLALYGWAVSEADAPDDGIRMVSSENEEAEAETSKGSIKDILQHIEVDVNQNNDVYVGLRFSY